jgi:Amt family ammonium transporter
VLGALLIGLLGSKDLNPAGLDGVFYGGGWKLMAKQAEAVGATVGYSFVATLIIAYGINLIWKMKMTEDQELEGMDTVLHNETAYESGGLFSGGSLGSSSSGGSTISVPREEVKA